MKIRPIVYVVPLLILAASLLWGSSLLLRVFFLLLAVGVSAFLWVSLGVRGLRLQPVDLPVDCRVGGNFKEEITVVNDSRLPKLMVKAEEVTNLPGDGNVSVLNLSSGGSHSWQRTVTCRRRGRYSLGSLSVTSGDPFGLFSRQRKIGQPRDIIIYPQVVELPFYRTSFSSLVDFGHGASGRRISQISPSASSVREMVSGDSQEHIHWRSTAHTGKLMVKVFDAEHSSDNTKNAWIVLDMHQSAHYGEGDETTEEYGVGVAASLAKRYLDDGMRVGLMATAEQDYSFSPGSGEPHFLKMLESLALMRARGKMPVEHIVSETGRFESNCTVIVITPQSTDPVLNSLRRLKNYGHTVVAVFLDGSSFGGTLSPTHAAHTLGSLGVQVHVIRSGDNFAKAFDSRVAVWYSRYM